MSEKLTITNRLKEKGAAGAFLLLAVFIMPFLALAKHENKIYVDANASGSQNGSANHPYKSISQALEHADKNSEVHIASGKYKENIEIPKGVEVFGSDRDKVTIESDERDDPAVIMKDDTKINEVTVKGGKYGIEVKEDSEASIIECIVKDSRKDGVKIKKGSTKKSNPVTISDTVIKDNKRAGVFSEKRRVVIVKSQILNNGSDGIDLASGVSAWIERTKTKDNNGSGMKFSLDGSSIWTKYNTVTTNDREGIEINAYGSTGRIDINKSKIANNDRYGIAKIKRNNSPIDIWKGLTIENTGLAGNKLGEISNIIKIF
jgi:hypothetical protein